MKTKKRRRKNLNRNLVVKMAMRVAAHRNKIRKSQLQTVVSVTWRSRANQLMRTVWSRMTTRKTMTSSKMKRNKVIKKNTAKKSLLSQSATLVHQRWLNMEINLKNKTKYRCPSCAGPSACTLIASSTTKPSQCKKRLSRRLSAQFMMSVPWYVGVMQLWTSLT